MCPRALSISKRITNKRHGAFPLLLLLLLFDDDADDDDDDDDINYEPPEPVEKQFERFIRMRTNIKVSRRANDTTLTKVAMIKKISDCDIAAIDNFLDSLPFGKASEYIHSDDHVCPIIMTCKNVELFKVLLKHDRNVNVRFRGNTALLRECARFDIERINLLVHNMWVDMNVRSEYGVQKFTPLMWFCHNSRKWKDCDKKEINSALYSLVTFTKDVYEKLPNGKAAFDLIDDASKDLLIPYLLFRLQEKK